MEEVNSNSQSTDVEQPHHPVNHSRPFFYVQPPSQPYFMYQWPMDLFGQFGFPSPAFNFGRPYMPPYPYMQYPGYVVPHAPMQPTDYRRVAPLFPSVTSYDLRFRQHFQQMSVPRETVSSEAQTEPGDRVGKLVDRLDGVQACEKSGVVKEANVMLSSTPAVISCTHEAEKLSCGDAKCESQPSSESAKATQEEETNAAALIDSAVYDAESSHGRLEECALSGVHPLDSSSIHELSQSREGDGKRGDEEIPCFQSEKSDRDDASSVLGTRSLASTKVQDSGAYVSEISDKSSQFEGKALDEGKPVGSLSPESVEVIEPLVQTALDDLPYQILRLPCNKTTTGLDSEKEVDPLLYLDAASTLLPSKRYSFGSAYSYSYYPQVAQERQSVLSPSLDELSSRDEMFSTDVEDELVSGQVYIGGGKLTETDDAPNLSSKELRDDDTYSVGAKTCACCGASLPEDEAVLTERFSGLEQDLAHELSDQDCDCSLEVSSACETQTLRQNAPRSVLPPCSRQTAKHKARKAQEEVERSEQDHSLGRGECREQHYAPPKTAKGKSQKGGQARSPYLEHQWREGRQGDLLDQESWTSCSGKQKPRACRPANGFQEKGRPGRRRSSCKMFAQQRPRRNEYDDKDEAEFSYCQRGRGSMKRRGTRY